MLMVNTTLQYLDISSNKIGDDGVGQITEGLKVNCTLINLSVLRCGFSAKGMYT